MPCEGYVTRNQVLKTDWIANAFYKKQGRIHGISRSPSSFLPAEKKRLRTDGPTDGRTDGRTHPLIESWLTTKNKSKKSIKGQRETEAHQMISSALVFYLIFSITWINSFTFLMVSGGWLPANLIKVDRKFLHFLTFSIALPGSDKIRVTVCAMPQTWSIQQQNLFLVLSLF